MMTKIIPLTRGKVALIDDEDFNQIASFKWCYHEGYAMRSSLRGEGHRTIRMHRVITNAPEGMDVDHINGDRLDNRRCNLRVCTTAQNLHNNRAHKNSTSGYKGVSGRKDRPTWRASIYHNGHSIHLGCFAIPEDAARAYDDAARKYYGEFARVNFP